MQTRLSLKKTNFCHPLHTVDLNPVWNTVKSTQKGPTFRLFFHNERLVNEIFPNAISLHISSLTVQVLKSSVALTVWQKTTFRTAYFTYIAQFSIRHTTTIKRQTAFDFELVRRNLLSCTAESIILGHNVKICTLLCHFAIQQARRKSRISSSSSYCSKSNLTITENNFLPSMECNHTSFVLWLFSDFP